MMHDNEVIFHREVSVSEMEEQLRYGFQFCRDHFPSLSVKTLYLSPAASSSLSWMQNMGCVLQTVNPFKKITSTFEPLFPKLFLAFGLALRGCHARN